MYPDPKRIKDNRHTIRLSTYEDEMVQAASKLYGNHPASIIRELAMAKLAELLGKTDTPQRGASLDQKQA